LLTLNGPNRR